MTISNKGLELIKSHEGLRLEAYLCPANVWTIGYGHTATAKKGMRISKYDAELLLIKDLKQAETCVYKTMLPFNQNQFDALVSFVFNVGCGNFSRSTLLKLAKQNINDPAIQLQFNRWIHGGGKILPGLVRRRKEESELYFS